MINNSKYFFKVFIFICVVILISTSKVYAFVSFTPDKHPVLTAAKGKHTKHYKPGNYLRITYKSIEGNYDKVNGKLIRVTNDSIEMVSKKNKPSIYIAISDITSVSKLHKEGRRGWIPMMIIFIFLTILGVININSLLGLVFLAIPAVALYTYVPFLFIIFLSDILSKKSIAKGWQFYSK